MTEALKPFYPRKLELQPKSANQEPKPHKKHDDSIDIWARAHSIEAEPKNLVAEFQSAVSREVNALLSDLFHHTSGDGKADLNSFLETKRTKTTVTRLVSEDLPEVTFAIHMHTKEISEDGNIEHKPLISFQLQHVFLNAIAVRLYPHKITDGTVMPTKWETLHCPDIGPDDVIYEISGIQFTTRDLFQRFRSIKDFIDTAIKTHSPIHRANEKISRS